MSAPVQGFRIDGIFGQSLTDVMAERVRAVLTFGHDAQADDAGGLHALGAKATAFMQIADDRATGGIAARNLPAARKKAVQAVAIGLAFIDAIDREIAREESQHG